MSNITKVGDVIWYVREHLYYVPEHAGPLLEYSVCKGKVIGHYNGRIKEAKIIGDNPDGYKDLIYCKESNIGHKQCFWTATDAAEYAKKLTDDYERRWAWLGPLRRPWENLLKERK